MWPARIASGSTGPVALRQSGTWRAQDDDASRPRRLTAEAMLQGSRRCCHLHQHDLRFSKTVLHRVRRYASRRTPQSPFSRPSARLPRWSQSWHSGLCLCVHLCLQVLVCTLARGSERETDDDAASSLRRQFAKMIRFKWARRSASMHFWRAQRCATPSLQCLSRPWPSSACSATSTMPLPGLQRK